MRKLVYVSLCAMTLALAGCAPDLTSLAQDPATVSVHSVVQGPMWTVTTDITRVNSTNIAAAAGTSGTTVNVPLGSVVNPGPAKAAMSGAASTVPTTQPVGTTILAPVSVAQ